MLKMPFLVPTLMMTLTACGSTPARRAAVVATPNDVVVTGPQSDASAILAARDTLNRALRDRDARPFAHFWLENAHNTGGNGGLTIGRDSTVGLFSRFFTDSTFVSGVRTPERVDVGTASAGHRQAAEAGHWVWRTRRPAGVTEYQGRYLIFWQQTTDGWRILSELYVTTACVSGPGCGSTT